MKKITITALLALFIVTMSSAQNYNTGIGFRGGYSNGLTIKHFVSTKAAIEGIFASRWHGAELTGLYEIHNTAFSAPRLQWLIGFGGHIGFWNGEDTNWGNHGEKYTVVGIDGILGLEYSFREVPINLSIDWKPALNLVGYTGFWGDGGAFSIRYIF